MDKKTDDEIYDLEERCEKAIKSISKAILMRLIVMALLLWISIQNEQKIWIIGLMIFVMIINLTGLLPLLAELKKQIRYYKNLLNLESTK